MSDTSSNDAEQIMKQPNNNVSKMNPVSVATDISDKISTPPKNLSDMPIDVVGLIIERSRYKEQLILRKTSKSLRELVDKKKPACTRLKVSYKSYYINCNYNNHRVAYDPPPGPFAEGSPLYITGRYNTIISEIDWKQVAFDDLAFTLKNPKLQLEFFSFDTDDFDDYEVFQIMQNVLKSINHQLSVKKCEIDVTNLSNAMSILPYLKPGVLEKITIFSDRYDGVLSEFSKTMKEVALLDQWKQAKELQISCVFDDKVLKEHATHFKRFQFDEDYIEPETLLLIRDFLLNHTTFEFCSILSDFENTDDFQGVVGTKVSSNSIHYSIPDSDDYLEFIFTCCHITIEKKTKQNWKRSIN